ncbi:MAG TPA: hypothetical protein PK364_10040 [Synergistaceae bacterium]|nr:hypothetical protein [Synergistaceae bacterium]HPJ26674.1 hypothetical protein [Synergistaceae bacterium]HPQ37396.1 hypothetical protein [Synergistaceae bacterium]
MTGKIFFRERRKAQKEMKQPRFRVVAVSGLDLKFFATHLRKKELEALARAVEAELVCLEDPQDGSEIQE